MSKLSQQFVTISDCLNIRVSLHQQISTVLHTKLSNDFVQAGSAFAVPVLRTQGPLRPRLPGLRCRLSRPSWPQFCDSRQV